MTNFDPFDLTAFRPNHFGFGGLDRAAHLREKENWLEALQADPATLVVPLWRSRNLFEDLGDQEQTPPRPAYIPAARAGDMLRHGRHHAFLGSATVGNNYHHKVMVDLTHLSEEEALALTSEFGQFGDLREIGPLIGAHDGSILAYARGLAFWHQRHLFCGVCGAPTLPTKSGHQRSCSGTTCGSPHFPRTDPAVIMLVTDGDRALLGRQPIWPQGMYSTLAGFVEPGETLEHAVAREVFEESGIQVGNVTYHSSQPWPFPSSLMLGFYAEARSTKITIDETEVEDVQWFTRDELMNFADQGKYLPRKLSIARRLINDWLGVT